jgi:hypothetical protein
MKAAIAIVLLSCIALPAAAQSSRERAIKRCQDNRGADCTTEQGLKPWIDEEKPMTAEQRRSAAAAANQRRQNEAKQKPPGNQPLPR